MLKMLFTGVAIILGATQALATTLTWTWPTTRANGTALPLNQIASFVVYDTTVPAPGVPGTPVACNIGLPPTNLTGQCITATLSPGNHALVVVTGDNSTPPNISAVSNAATVVIGASAPAAITDLRAQ